MSTQRQHGFTLVELLVVISIIALLIALLLPSLSQAHRRAADMQCMFNMHQCHVALSAYATDCKSYPPNLIHDGTQYWQGVDTSKTAPQGIGAAVLLVEGGYLPQDYPTYSDWIYNDPKQRISKVTFCSEYLRIGTPVGFAWVSGGGFMYAGGPGSYTGAGNFMFNSASVPNEPAWYFLSMTDKQQAAGGVAVEESGPLLACDTYTDWSDRVGIPHGGIDIVNGPGSYLHDAGSGYRNFLMNDGQVVPYNGARGF